MVVAGVNEVGFLYMLRRKGGRRQKERFIYIFRE